MKSKTKVDSQKIGLELRKFKDSAWNKIMTNNPPLSRDEEKTATVEKLAMSNMAFFFKNYRKFLSTFSLDEYCSEIYSGLVEAGRRFDRTRDIKFVTFANSYVYLFIMDYIRLKDNIITINRSSDIKIKNVLKFIYSLRDEGKEATVEAVMLEFKFSEKVAKKYLDYAASVYNIDSLHRNIKDDDVDGMKLADVISSNNVIGANEDDFVADFSKREVLERMETALKKLSKESKKIIKCIFYDNLTERQASKKLKMGFETFQRKKEITFKQLKYEIEGVV